MTVVFCHAGSVRVDETTTLGIAFIFSPNSPADAAMAGQAAANPS
jgi:hypothetical protein